MTSAYKYTNAVNHTAYMGSTTVECASGKLVNCSRRVSDTSIIFVGVGLDATSVMRRKKAMREVSAIVTEILIASLALMVQNARCRDLGDVLQVCVLDSRLRDASQ